MKQLIFIICTLIALVGCQFLVEELAPTDWAYHPVIPVPIVTDTVCTTYDPILLPEFITAYMDMDPYQTERTLHVGPHIDTIEAGEDIQISLDSMLALFLPSYIRKVYVNDSNDLLMSVMIKGTNDKNKLLGLLRIDYNGYRHYWGCISQSMIVAGSQTLTEFNHNLIEFPSFRYVNWRKMFMALEEYNNSVSIALDTSNCKGGRDWLDFRHSPHPTLQVFRDYGNAAGWTDVLGANQYTPGFTIDFTSTRVSDSEIIYWLEKGYSVKTRL